MICIVYSVEDESTIDRVCNSLLSVTVLILSLRFQLREIYSRLAAICELFCCFFQIREYWLPLLRRTLPEEHRRPVILVGNKSDLMEISSMEVITLWQYPCLFPNIIK